MFDDHAGAAERFERRRTWPVRVYPLGGEPGDDLSATTTPEERLTMMWPLAIEAWTVAGLPLPEYDRRSTPVQVLDLRR